jgi:hypothetical protein
LAIAEWPTASGPADSAVFVGLTLVGVAPHCRPPCVVAARIVSICFRCMIAHWPRRQWHLVICPCPPANEKSPRGQL